MLRTRRIDKMKLLSDIFEEIFSKHSQSLSFKMPGSIKERKLFTETVIGKKIKRPIKV